jgi:hypothetical protein
LITAVVMLVPIYVIPAMAEFLAPPLHKLSIVGIPVAILYALFRDSMGKGTSFGKR